MSIKIQINSLDALERLIGGNSEIEIEIRGNIVQEFSKRYLKDIVAADAIKQVTSEVINSVREEIRVNFLSEVKPSGSYWSKIILKPEIKKELIDSAKYELMEELRQEIKTSLGVTNARETVENEVNKAVNGLIDRLSEESLQSFIDVRAKAKLKEMLDNK